MYTYGQEASDQLTQEDKKNAAYSIAQYVISDSSESSRMIEEKIKKFIDQFSKIGIIFGVDAAWAFFNIFTGMLKERTFHVALKDAAEIVKFIEDMK